MAPIPSASPIVGVGIDLVEVSRMREILSKDSRQFLENTFTALERAYCSAHADPAAHFAGTFAAKEAVRKATGDLERPFSATEIRRTPAGKPEAWLGGKRDASLHVSISHTSEDATAIAIQTA